LRDDFLSAAELSFYRVLSSVVAGRAVLCAKVNLSDLFYVPRPHENRGALNRIDRKHVDFVLCRPDTMEPLVGIELDDSSHARPDRQKRDALVDDVFAAAGLPLIHYPAQRGYTLTDLAAQVDPDLQPDMPSTMSAPPQPSPAAAPSPIAPPASGLANPDAVTVSPPLCPRCGVAMVQRQAARGNRQGQTFFGCPNYPKCRQTG
jgi:hypothetical protein